MSEPSPDPTRWVRALAEVGEQSGTHDPQAQIAAVVAELERRHSRRGGAWAVGAAVGLAAAAVVLLWGRSAWMQASADDPYAAEAVAAPTPPTGEARADGGVTHSVSPEPPAPEPPAPDVPTSDETAPDDEPATPPTVAAPPSPQRSPRRPPPPEPTASPDPEPSVDPTPSPEPDELDSVADLLAIATKARAERDAHAARNALLQIRDRFPEHAAAGRATFLLGRVEEELANDPSAAARWFARYVTEFPDGEFVSQARGRVMAHLERRGEDERARAAAREYLEHHPDGAYARRAEELLR